MAACAPREFWDALYTDDVDTITELLEGDDINLNGGDESCGMETPLMRLCHCEISTEDAAAILEFMLIKGPDVNVIDCEGRTVLCHACMSGRTYFIERLSKVLACDPNIADCYGNTALMFGVYYGDVQVIGTLLTSFSGNGPGIDINATNNEGITALVIAEQNGYTDIADYLHQYLSWSEAVTEAVNNEPREDQHEDNARGTGQCVGDRVANFRRRKLRHALGPLVVQNKLQTSKSADYSQHYKAGHNNIDTRENRQHSYSAGAHQGTGKGHIADRLYRQTATLHQEYSYEEEEFEDPDDESSSEEDEEEEAEDEDEMSDGGDLYDETETPRRGRNGRHRKGSVSLPDLRNQSRKNTLAILKPYPNDLSGDENYCDSGYDTRSSQCTVSREELFLPNLPEGGTFGEEEDYTPRTRRGSFSLPDLRGVKKCLVVSSQNSTPRQNPDCDSKNNTPRGPAPRNQDISMYDFKQNDLKDIKHFIRADYDQESDDSDGVFDDNPSIDNDICTPRDIGLKLPMLSAVSSTVSTPRRPNIPDATQTNLSNLNKKLNKLTNREPRTRVTASTLTTQSPTSTRRSDGSVFTKIRGTKEKKRDPIVDRM